MKKTNKLLLIVTLCVCFALSAIACTTSDIGGVTDAIKGTVTKLDTPDGVYLDDDNVLHWNVVSNASFYLVVIGDTNYERTAAVCDLKPLLSENGDYYVSIIAKSNRPLYEDSDASSPIKVTFTGIASEEKPYGQFDDLATKESFLGYGFDVINSAVFSDKYVISSFSIFNPDELIKLRLLKVNSKNAYIEEVMSSEMESFLADWNVQAKVNVKWGGKSIGGSVGVKTAYSGGVENAASKYFHCISITNQKFHIVLQSDMETYRSILSRGFESALYSDMEPAELFKNYGTHFITSAIMGGKINSYYLYTSTREANYTDLSAKVSVDVRYLAGKTTVGVEGGYRSAAEDEGVYIKNTLEVLGGGDFAMMSDEDLGKNYAEWEKSLNENPSLIGIKDSSSLIPIWNLIDAKKDSKIYSYDYDGDGIYEQGNRSQQLQAYFNAYGIESYNALMQEAGLSEIITPEEISNARVNNIASENGEYEAFAGTRNEITFSVKPDQATGYTKTASITKSCDYARITNDKGVLALEIDPDAPAGEVIDVVLSAGSVKKAIKVVIQKKYTVSFLSNGGSEVAPYKDVLHNSQIDEPTAPVKEGYTFLGWYTDSNFKEDTLYKFGEQAIQSNLKLYARWQAIKPRISFESNGGSIVDAIVINYKGTISAPTQPSKDGYTFVGWYSDKSLEEKFDFNTQLTQDTTLYAKWIVSVYTVTFVTNGGSEVEPYTDVLHNSQISEPAAPVKEGYTFLGWYTDSNFKEDTLYKFGERAIQSNLKLYARWQAIKPRISFETNGGSAIGAIVINYKETISVPTQPTKEGYTFVGWYSDKSLEEKFDFNTQLTQDTTLYTKWLVNVYTVTFVTNGGNLSETSVKAEYGSKITEPVVTKNGYSFGGWFKDADLGVLFDFSTDRILNDTVLYAKWSKNLITVKFQTYCDIAVDDRKIEYDSTLGVNMPKPVRANYKFGGWFKEKTLETQVYDFTKFNEATFADIIVNNGVVLHAKWEAVAYKIVYNANGGTGSMPDREFVYDEKQKTAENKFVREGYTFVGWALVAESSEKVYVDFENSMAAYAVSGQITLYAQWLNNAYKIVFDKNTPDGAMVPSETLEPLSCIYDEDKKLTKNEFTVNGWIFNGWATTAHGSAVFADEGKIRNLTSKNNEVITLYAVWKVDPYLVGKYVSNGSVISDTDGENSYTVYNNINETPQLNCGGKVVVDWSTCGMGTYDYVTAVNSNGIRYGGGNDDLEIIYGITEVYFVGSVKSIYSNVRIVTANYPVASVLTIHFKDMNVTADVGVIDSRFGDIAQDAGMNLTIDCHGVNTFKATGVAKSTILNHKNVKIVGDGVLSVIGGSGSYVTTVVETTTSETSNDAETSTGDESSTGETTTKTTTKTDAYDGGSAIVVNNLIVEMTGTLKIMGGNGGDGIDNNKNGTNGGVAIVADNLTVNMAGTLHVTGGNGGKGYKANSEKSTIALSGEKDGGNGGNGGVAIVANKLVVDTVEEMVVSGGNGGNAADGLDGEKVTIMYTKGGNGGNGGNGDKPITCGTLIGEGINEVVFSYGNGGNGGNGGSSQDSTGVWKPGNGGNGGNGAVAGVGGRGGIGEKSNGIDGVDGETWKYSL